MARLGFYFNGSRCVGCRACQIACKDVNNLAVGILYRHVSSYETGAFPTPGYYHHSSTCNHCADPACVKYCPSGAMYVAENETVQHDDEICIGCKNCMNRCPYGVPQWKPDLEITGKCNMCSELWNQEERPVCVDACPQRVLEWGNLNELAKKHPDAVMDLPILPDSTETNPSTLITPRAAALDPNFRQKCI